MSLDLEHHLTFVSPAQAYILSPYVKTLANIFFQYGAYHHNSVNIAIHMVCVPLILISGFCLVRLPTSLLGHMRVGLST